MKIFRGIFFFLGLMVYFLVYWSFREIEFPALSNELYYHGFNILLALMIGVTFEILLRYFLKIRVIYYFFGNPNLWGFFKGLAIWIGLTVVVALQWRIPNSVATSLSYVGATYLGASALIGVFNLLTKEGSS